MLQITNLHAGINNVKILRGITLNINPGEVHVIMGPNGSGKSSLANILSGNPQYSVSEGSIEFSEEDLLEMAPEERASKGLFLAFQYPIEIPGINNSYFIRTALNAQREFNNQPKISSPEFIREINEKVELLNFDKYLLKRQVNEGFSGGEKKRNEILQMAMLKPKLAILDEIDSGLDIDALKDIGNGISTLRNGDNAFLIITHYPRLLKYIEPDFVHILYNGEMVESGDKTLANKVEQLGYEDLNNDRNLENLV